MQVKLKFDLIFLEGVFRPFGGLMEALGSQLGELVSYDVDEAQECGQ